MLTGALAFATDEGRIGFITNALSTSPKPTFMEFKYRGSVYNLAFGPNGSDSNSFSLYSLGDGKVTIHDNQNSINLEELINNSNSWQRKAPSRSSMEFQPVSFKHLILGSDDGSVEVFNTADMKIICTFKSFQKLIQSLAWHPMTTVQGENSELQNYVATASNEYDIHIWNLEDKLLNYSEGTNPVFTKPDIVLSGHKLRVVALGMISKK